jgi:hypothetical protein
LSARVRLLSTGHGSKNDQVDAVSVAVAALHAVSLRSVEVDDTITALRELTEHRDDLVKTRTQTINRLHQLLTQLLPGGAPTPPSAATAAGLLRRVRPDGTLGGTRRRLATDLIGEIRRLDRRIAALAELISAAVAESGSTLTGLCGIGDLGAAKLLGRVGCVDRFPTAARFASYAGVASRKVSSGDVVRHRLSRAGDWQINAVACHGDHSDPLRHCRTRLLPTQTTGRQEPQGGIALPETTTRREQPYDPTTTPVLTQRGALHGRCCKGCTLRPVWVDHAGRLFPREPSPGETPLPRRVCRSFGGHRLEQIVLRELSLCPNPPPGPPPRRRWSGRGPPGGHQPDIGDNHSPVFTTVACRSGRELGHSAGKDSTAVGHR